MRNPLILSTLLAVAGLASAGAIADGDGERSRDMNVQTFAVIGDWPYNQNLLANAPWLINSVNGDRDVSLLHHVGDIHSGSQACTSAGILPPIAASNPGWNGAIFGQFQKFRVPVISTPGDNEWTDCHKTKQFKSGALLNELAAVRNLFFSRPGKTLGYETKDVWTQARDFDPAFPTDAQFVENVAWQDGHTVFMTLDMPGSNNDSLPWTNGFENPAVQLQERTDRTSADIRWMKAVFRHARDRNAKAVVIALQADMWDPAALGAGGDGLDKYTLFVQELASQALLFNKPVLLFNGDSHIFGADQPLADSTSATGRIHLTPPVKNLTRITVQGSTNGPAEWLRVTIDTTKPYPFSWVNVPYCANPLGVC